MRRKQIVRSLCLLATFLALHTRAPGQEPRPALTVWLIPVELADEKTTMDIDEFDNRVGGDGWVTVLNTRCRTYREQLKNWNPAFDYPNFPLVKGQLKTIEALRRFSQRHGVHTRVRFVWWGQAFKELQTIAEAEREAKCESVRGEAVPIAPDVAQVGSSWVTYFAGKNISTPNPAADGLEWRDVPGTPRASLRYTTDVRLIFYWRPADSPLQIDGSSWEAVLDSLGRYASASKQPSRPMAMPNLYYDPNLLHDYVPLVWSGGGRFIGEDGDAVDLTSDRALAVPELLAMRSTLTDEKKQWHRLVAFPEISHEEAVHDFWKGEYIAVLEPAGFIKRWRDEWGQRASRDELPLPRSFLPEQAGDRAPSPPRFWDYAGVAAPPRTFIGGSDLIVMGRSAGRAGGRGAAFELARFLATDEEYTRILAELGTLPAQRKDYGIDILSASLEDEPAAAQGRAGAEGAGQFARALRLALARRDEQEYPALETWPTVFEAQPQLELLQRVWRRVREGNVAELKAAAAEAELAINERINWLTWATEALKRRWLLLVFFLLAACATVALVAHREYNIKKVQLELERARARDLDARAKAEEERARVLDEWSKALDQVRKVRGFTSAALLIVYEVHNIFGNKYKNTRDEDREKGEKALVLMTGIQGWRRGRDDANWLDTPLEKVIWSAIILAIESTYTAQLFKEWEREAGGTDARAFLEKRHLLRDEPGLYEDCPPFYFEVECRAGKEVQMPLMLEQALVCLLQNAIKASRATECKHRCYRPVKVAYDEAADEVYVSNEGPPLAEELCDVLNESRDLDEFERRIDRLLVGPAKSEPGIGLVEAYSVASQCYGGLVVDRCRPKVTIRLRPACEEVVA